MRAAAARMAGVLLGVCMLGFGAWAVGVILYTVPASMAVRFGLAASFLLLLVVATLSLWLPRWRRLSLAAYGIVGVAVLAWWSQLRPSNDRDWQTDVARLASATIDGNQVTVHNIRNFEYRGEFDYVPRYYDQRFDLRELSAVDVVAVYWMGPAIAHVFLSFEFNGREHIAISIEARKEKGENYSSTKGFFRQYELYYVVADERDVIGLRTNIRDDPPEDVYIYRALGDIESGRRLFLEYLRQINSLAQQPVFYNTLTTNCTTSIWMNTRVNPARLSFDWRILISGYLPDLLYSSQRLQAGGLSFAALQRRAHVNARARAAAIGPDFSKRIRQRTL